VEGTICILILSSAGILAPADPSIFSASTVTETLPSTAGCWNIRLVTLSSNSVPVVTFTPKYRTMYVIGNGTVSVA